jgi:hypothetical protein
MEKIRKNQSGQAITEYVLLLSIIVVLYTILIKGVSELNVVNKLKKPLETQFKYTYQYGHPDARGPSEGGPTFIPEKLDDNFRIFINPPISD